MRDADPTAAPGALPMLTRGAWERLPAVHKEMLQRLAARPPVEGPGLACCFDEGTSSEVIDAFNALVFGNLARYNQTSRWAATASNPGGLGTQGDPVIVTYSFVPDGTPVPDGVGEGAGVSNLFAFLNGIYGSPAVWQPIYAQIFARWSQLTGITYIFEPNDDGASMFGAQGVLGVRGDLRMSGKFIDGPSSILAYNFFPAGGDMVIDTGDTFFNDTSGGSLRLRNVLAHEHGHGMGQLHVCPVTQSKLMEPTVTTVYDGPRHDDIRNAQRHYGDPFEPDDTTGTATDLGTPSIGAPVVPGAVPPPAVPFGSLLSIDADGEQDYFRFTIAGSRRITASVTPVGLTYDSSSQSCSGQPASCCSGALFNSLGVADLNFQIIAPDQFTVIGTFAAQPAGAAESVADLLLPAGGNYYIRVYEGATAPSQSQLYNLTFTINPAFLPLRVALPSGAPSFINPGVSTSFSVQIDVNDDTIVPGSTKLFYSYTGGPFLSTPLAPLGGNMYTATLPPALCTDSPRFYVGATGAATGAVTSPAAGAAGPLTAFVGTDVVVAAFNFETAAGWTASNDVALTDGPWDRGVPVNCSRGDPPADFDGSGQCFLTDNSNLNACNSDVDGGTTTLTSPVFNVTGLIDPEVIYARWYSNTFGADPQNDTFVVQVSSNAGGSWVTLEVVGPTLSSPNPEVGGGWFLKTFRIASFVTPTTQFQVRFIASDLNAGSVVEAGVDAFKVRGGQCTFTAPPCCQGNADKVTPGAVDFADVTSVFTNWGAGYGVTGPGDADCSGTVDFADITSVFTNWQNACL